MPGRVIGLGGVFVKAKDPEKLRGWYRDVLGVQIESWGGAQLWNDGPRSYGVWSAFAETSGYFAPSEKAFMVNLRVENLDGLLASLKEKGAHVLDRREDSPDGRFGYVVDPEGTLLELWEPAPPTT
jgi:predicted enzyme related to lactoylglutathione lyase